MAKKKVAAKKAKPREHKYDSKLAIKGTLDQVLRVSVAKDKK